MNKKNRGQKKTYMSNTVIKIENLSKIYRLGEIGTGTLSHDLNRWVRMNLMGQNDPYAKIGHINDKKKSTTNLTNLTNYLV